MHLLLHANKCQKISIVKMTYDDVQSLFDMKMYGIEVWTYPFQKE